MLNKTKKNGQPQMTSKTRLIFTFLVGLMAASCGFSMSSTPTRNDNACTLIKHKKSWVRDLKKVEKKWGVPAAVQLAIIWKESSFNARAKTSRTKVLFFIPGARRSTASGYAQALDGTWADYKKRNGLRFANRADFGDSVDFIGWYLNNANKTLRIKKNDAYRMYIAYHEGLKGYQKGSYKAKPWLMSTAKQVKTRAALYSKQLKKCPAF
ncbi:MAG: hypothetical protein ACI8Y9_001115 [Paracoccaceae bacterium]|jgi:hypothetical protein